MSGPKVPSFRQRIALFAEAVFMSSLVPKDRVGRVYGLIFKMPLLLRRLRLSFLIPGNVLILTTKGRRTGLPRRTPMECSLRPEEGVYLVMSGWEGRTDWYRNARADPRVRVWLAGKEWAAVAEPVPDEQVAQLMRGVAEVSPSALRMWSRWSPVPIDGSDASYLAAAPHFPSLYLRPAKAEAG
jgi:deazaflavin-dependent oxidoreductase (nitroreductase family)